MTLNAKQRKHLKGLAHHLKPVVLVGNAGVTDPVLKEIELALGYHELIKIRLPGVDRSERSAMLEKICAASCAEAVQEIGRVAVVYRPAEQPRITLPK
ncbi:MAG: ribosome assembly RNA-binding protein YhbY [Gammaproteobacteria bacterium]|nr:ribosome assembly RNA-binding protein YhbY [Gammaproteobacteria bacterium]